MDPAREQPLIGASGAVAGVIGAYLVLHPRAQVWGLMLNLMPLKISASWVLGLWVAVQVCHVVRGRRVEHRVVGPSWRLRDGPVVLFPRLRGSAAWRLRPDGSRVVPPGGDRAYRPFRRVDKPSAPDYGRPPMPTVAPGAGSRPSREDASEGTSVAAGRPASGAHRHDRTRVRRALRVLGGETMKILVPVKRVVDYNVKIRVKADGSGVELANVKMSMNPFDEIAVEEALRLKEAGKATEVVVCRSARPRPPRRIRTGLAMGADRGILVKTRRRRSSRSPSPRSSRASSRRSSPASSSSASRPSTTTPTRPARCWPPCWAGRRAPSPPRSSLGDGSVEVTREVDGGLQTVELKLPAIVTTDLRLNEPRYASLPNIMKAKKKPIDEKTPGRLRRRPRAAPEGAQDRPSRRAARPAPRSASVDELVAKLKNEAGVI